MSLESLIQSCAYLQYRELLATLLPRGPALRWVLASATICLVVRSLLCH